MKIKLMNQIDTITDKEVMELTKLKLG